MRSAHWAKSLKDISTVGKEMVPRSYNLFWAVKWKWRCKWNHFRQMEIIWIKATVKSGSCFMVPCKCTSLCLSLSPPFLCHLLTFICLEVSGTVSKEHIKFGKVPGFRTRYKFGIGGVEDLWEEKERWGVGEYHRTKAGIERVGLWKPHDWKILLLMLSMDLHFNQNNHRVAVD